MTYTTGPESTVVSLWLSSDVTGFHLDLHADADVAVDRVLDSSGNVVLDYRDFPSPRLFSQGLIPLGPYSSFNWPVRGIDGPLKSGEWTVEVAAIDKEQKYVPDLTLQVDSYTKNDDDLSDGTVSVRILFDETTGQDEAIRVATQNAVAEWRDIYSNWGLSLNIAYEDTTLDFDLDVPDDRTDQYRDLNQTGEVEQITVIIGHYIDGGLDKFGITGAIPGAVAHSPKGVVLVSWLALAGQDAKFDSEEIVLFGETIAHESSHYLGLFHPVEDSWDRWDFLSDTQECSDTASCEADLGDNLMFPYPVCDATACQPQRVLSVEQQEVIHRFTGTL